MATAKTDSNKAAAIAARIFKAMVKGAGRGGRLWMEVVITEGKQNAPVLTGNLKGSGRADGPTKSGPDLIIQGGFGAGVSASYAVVQHEKFFPYLGMALLSEQNKALPLITKGAVAEMKKVKR